MQLLQPAWSLLLLHTAVASAATQALFQPWNASEWVASDDSIRPGGQSASHLEISADATVARFYGTLDYEALNGSGFASQRTVDGWAGLDLSTFDRVRLQLPYADGKTYTLNLKDVEPAVVNGREQASVSWEYDFPTTASATAAQSVEVLFADLVPTYQGSVVNDTAPLNLAGIKRVNFMIRRYVPPPPFFFFGSAQNSL